MALWVLRTGRCSSAFPSLACPTLEPPLNRSTQATATASLLTSVCVVAAGCSLVDKLSGGGCPTVSDTGMVDTPAGRLAHRLGLPGTFQIGLGNDLVDGELDAWAFRMDPPVPLHYLYLVGLPGRDGWPSWNEGGRFIDVHAQSARDHCAVPVFTLFAMAVDGEGDPATIADPTYMAAWWEGYTLALDRLSSTGQPAILHVEPDLWGFLQLRTDNTPPDAIVASVTEHVPACSDLGDTVSGFGRCIVRLARRDAPNVFVGFHASLWADPDPSAVAGFLLAAGAGDTDLLFVETLDRDAGCFEARAPGCERDDGPWYWDATNQTEPSFKTHLAATHALHTATGLPLMWWQMPMGTPSTTPGGRPGAYRDNRVTYVFDHPEEFVAAGGLGAMFGPGWERQTDASSDGGQFRARWEAYAGDPTPLR